MQFGFGGKQMDSELFDEDHENFRGIVREFVRQEVEPNLRRWDSERRIDRATWRAAARQGILGLPIPEQFGGGGATDYRFRVVVQYELARVGANALQSGFSTNDDIVVHYLLRQATPEQAARWLPGFADGTSIGAIAMSEPAAGSDLRGISTRAERTANGWRLNGSKTFITSGIEADLVVVFARTDDSFTLFAVERGMAGFERGRQLDKVGLHAQDTAELFFTDVELSDQQVLGVVGGGLAALKQSLPLERLGIAIAAQASAEAVLGWTISYVKERRAFGARLADLQVIGHRLAHLHTAVEVSREYVHRCIREWNAGALTAIDAAKAKAWATDLQGEVIDAGVQFHGGYGYMVEYPVARAYLDARIQRIYGGANEVMMEIVQRDLLR
ncbi:MAG TPA: acyl-CoA dehydrogenase family protein [Ilumatobacteraceae bacterium]|nr:acyl-CoA dehydrogenase family protein [Ilumatobacteraceae bacterium]